jgi:hypothetical protein
VTGLDEEEIMLKSLRSYLTCVCATYGLDQAILDIEYDREGVESPCEGPRVGCVLIDAKE